MTQDFTVPRVLYTIQKQEDKQDKLDFVPRGYFIFSFTT